MRWGLFFVNGKYLFVVGALGLGLGPALHSSHVLEQSSLSLFNGISYINSLGVGRGINSLGLNIKIYNNSKK